MDKTLAEEFYNKISDKESAQITLETILMNIIIYLLDK